MSSPRRDQTRWWTEEMEATSGGGGEAHKGRERGSWAAAGRDHEIGDLEILEGGGCGRTKMVPFFFFFFNEVRYKIGIKAYSGSIEQVKVHLLGN